MKPICHGADLYFICGIDEMALYKCRAPECGRYWFNEPTQDRYAENGEWYETSTEHATEFMKACARGSE